MYTVVDLRISPCSNLQRSVWPQSHVMEPAWLCLCKQALKVQQERKQYRGKRGLDSNTGRGRWGKVQGQGDFCAEKLNPHLPVGLNEIFCLPNYRLKQKSLLNHGLG